MAAAVVVPLTVSATLYVIGITRLWRRAGIGSGIGAWSVLSFALGWLVMAASLAPPVAWVAQILFSVHMTQHMLLMLVAAPLPAFGRPLLAWLWVLDEASRKRVRRVTAGGRFVGGWRTLSAPLSVFLIQAIAALALACPVVVRGGVAPRIHPYTSASQLRAGGHTVLVGHG